MGKRSRKREPTGQPRARPTTASAGRGAPAAAPAAPTSRKARMAEAPPAPWSPFPLVELCILAGLILLGVGFFSTGDGRLTLLVVGLALVAISAIELSIREHFAGFRSHTTLLAAATVIFPLVPLTVVFSIPRVPMLVAGAVLFGIMFIVLRSVFARRAGGFGFRA
ncbi:hypothetical protein NBH00_05970 [Paraconexibacter antarcticus]|uniref:Uncharacterized protein n=1 Tax=Paraconexibacter antarcticus TaxID=2949664 RepID=A0ABY5DWU0_9ACTN|nr:hypothetical protein [Paraconexibacter antarcticus]UTI65758.1 hypothetical protein NBH00_05970 [Paraconexibacter antarcticus]